MEGQQHEKFDEWAIVDVMGHQRFVGKVTEQVIAGQGFVRVDIPATPTVGAWTKLIGTASIYAITPVSETIAVAMAQEREDVPLSRYELPESLRAPRLAAPPSDDDGFDPYEEDDD
jgi:hypothetical protein